MKNVIKKFKGVIDDETCDLLIKHIEKNIDTCMDLNWNAESRNNVICKQLYLQQQSDLDTRVFNVINNVITKYGELNPNFYATGDSGYALRKISGKTKLHYDDIFNGPTYKGLRNISIILGLNSDYEKGEFYFPEQNFTTTLKRGEALAFPVYFMYPHKVEEPIGFRYTINTWITHDNLSVHPYGDA